MMDAEEREEIKEIFDGMDCADIVYWIGYLEGVLHTDLAPEIKKEAR